MLYLVKGRIVGWKTVKRTITGEDGKPVIKEGRERVYYGPGDTIDLTPEQAKSQFYRTRIQYIEPPSGGNDASEDGDSDKPASKGAKSAK